MSELVILNSGNISFSNSFSVPLILLWCVVVYHIQCTTSAQLFQFGTSESIQISRLSGDAGE